MKNKKFTALFIVLFVGVFLVRREMTVQEYSQRLDLFMETYLEGIEASIKNQIEGGRILESVIRYLGVSFDEESFNFMAKDTFEEETMISISYIPNGIVQWIYPPTEDNNNVIGLNIFEYEPTKEEAMRSKESNELVISGPFILESGESGLTVRTPVRSRDNDFLGFVSILYDSKKIAYESLEAKSLEYLGYAYAVHSSFNGKRIPLLVSDGFNYNRAFQKEFVVANNTWDFFLYSTLPEDTSYMVILVSILEAVGFCAVLFIILKVVWRRYLSVQEQIALDPLTKLYNRKKLDKYIANEKEWKNSVFTIFYLDLNKFKPVNDAYGHLIGDKLLIGFAARLMQRFDKRTIRIRVGGDEFVVIIHSDLDEANIQRVVQRLIAMAEEEFIIDDFKIQISTSVGYAKFPNDGATIQEVLEKADAMMYAEKQKKKGTR